MNIVSLSPSFTEILERLGASPSLSGITDHCPEIEGYFEKIGSPKALKISEIERLKPDLVFADQNENRPEEIRELQKKMKVTSFDVRSVQAVLDTISAIGRLCGKEEAARDMIDEIAKEARENKTLAESGAPVPVLILLWNNPFLTVNFDTYISRAIEASGGVNVFHSDPVREFAIELEDMIDKNPSVLLLPSDPYPFRKRHIAGFRQYQVFSKNQIHLIDGHLISRFGPRTADFLRTLRHLLLEPRVQAK